MQVSEAIYPYYLTAWRRILVDWMGWPEERLAAWVGSWEDRITRNIHGWGDWFYHEDELHYVLPLLVPDDLADRLKEQRTRRMYNDFAELIEEELARLSLDVLITPHGERRHSTGSRRGCESRPCYEGTGLRCRIRRRSVLMRGASSDMPMSNHKGLESAKPDLQSLFKKPVARPHRGPHG